MSVYQTTKISEELYCIKEVCSTNLYLLIDEQNALLIDTGYGYGDLMKQIRSITDKPLLVAVTHGDPDHALGSFQFPEVLIHPADISDLRLNDDPSFKQVTIDYRKTKIADLEQKMDVKRYLQSSLKHTKWIPITEGDTIDLGNMQLRILEIPGHSKGSVAFYEANRGWLFTGDTITKYNIWNLGAFPAHCDPLSVLMASYEKIRKMGKPKIRKIYPAHGVYPLTLDVIDALEENIRHLLVHYQKDEEVHTFAGNGYRHEHNGYILLYTKEMLEEALTNGIEQKTI